MPPEDLPPLRDDVLYDAETAGLYVGREALWMKRAARAGDIDAQQVGRAWRWNADQIRELIHGDRHRAHTKRPTRRSARARR